MGQEFRRYWKMIDDENLWSRPSQDLDEEIRFLVGGVDKNLPTAPRYTSDRDQAIRLWKACLLDEPVPDGDALEICRALMEESEDVFC